MLHLSWTSFSSVPSPSSPLCLPHQRAALLRFKNSISLDYFCGDNYYAAYPKTETWNKSIDCCSWEGVKCDEMTGHVIGINLSRSCLVGSLFASANNSLFLLHNLQWLDLSYNFLYDSPLDNSSSSLFQLRNFRRLDLSYNYLDGAILPEFFSQLVSLTHLDLSYNGFSDTFSKLTFGALGFEMLARNLNRLRNLVLDSVDMSDVALTSFLNLSSSLQRLSLRECQLHGEFPTQLFQFSNLKSIGLGGNENLTGYLPQTNWSSGLELLDLSRCGFRGSIPPSFGNLSQLVSIDLSRNLLRGQIPDVFGNLTKLTSFTCSSCNLSGPMVQIQMPSSIQYVDLSCNDFHGPLPGSMFDLVNLTELRLSSNNLSGVIESVMLSKLAGLELLDLSNNSLLSLSTSDNEVNYSFSQLRAVYFSSCNVSQFPNYFRTSKLEVLDLSNNMISGGISKWEAERKELRISRPPFQLASRANSVNLLESSNSKSTVLHEVHNFRQ
ncbi:hypothetical protein V6N13_016392 [Hibiscus sabdariffa]